MPHKISILVRADVSRSAIDLLVTGCLTLHTAPILIAQLTKARELGPSEPILVDLTGVEHVERAALDLVRAAEAEITEGYDAPLRFALPTAAPTHPGSRTSPDGPGDAAPPSPHTARRQSA